MERGRLERRSRISALAHRTIFVIVGSPLFRAILLLASGHGYACQEMHSGESERKQRRGRCRFKTLWLQLRCTQQLIKSPRFGWRG